MPAVAAAEPRIGELARTLEEAGEKELRRMVRAARMARGRFHLFPVESDFTPALRAAFLERLRDDLAANGLRLRIVTLTSACWNVFAALEQEAPIIPGDVVMLAGLESTPGIVREAGAKPQRPPALAILNQQRETLRQQIAAPLFVWCPTYVYTALLEHAPDFFDQYTAKFHFTNAVPSVFTEIISAGLKFSVSVEDRLTDLSSLGSQAAVDLYRKQVAANPTPTPKRADALLDLVLALLRLPMPERSGVISEAKACAEEAIHLVAKRRRLEYRLTWAMGQMELGMIHALFLSCEQNANQKQALVCYKAALRVFTEVTQPEEWAMAQYLCGRTYMELASNRRGHSLLRAVASFEAALRVYTEDNYSLRWADTQLSLGFVYLSLSTGDNLVHLQQAFACCEAALHVYTEVDYPEQWANIQLGLATALLKLAREDRTTYLPLALSSMAAALRIFTETQYPDERANICNILGIICAQGGDVNNAKKAYQAALRSFAAANNTEMVQEVEAALESLVSHPIPPASSS